VTFVSYAQNFEDVMLRRALAHVERGFYIDVGAGDPTTDSVTRSFYELGWRGINVEPVRGLFEALVRDRPRDINLQVAARGQAGEVQFYEIVGTGLSTLVGEIARQHADSETYDVHPYMVTARTLTEICREHDVHEVHFLKIDVEGAERDVLEGLDLSDVRPWIILIEATHPQSRIDRSESWEDLVLGRGYHRVWFDGLNRFYVADEHIELDVHFGLPPNLWDDFETARERGLEIERAELWRRVSEATEQLTASREGLEALREEFEASKHEALLWRDVAEDRERQVALFRLELSRVLESSSWRLTAPLRSFGRALRVAGRKRLDP
jgi:FkbM family methyltransferase